MTLKDWSASLPVIVPALGNHLWQRYSPSQRDY
jgi:hypothetical protein